MYEFDKGYRPANFFSYINTKIGIHAFICEKVKNCEKGNDMFGSCSNYLTELYLNSEEVIDCEFRRDGKYICPNCGCTLNVMPERMCSNKYSRTLIVNFAQKLYNNEGIVVRVFKAQLPRYKKKKCDITIREIENYIFHENRIFRKNNRENSWWGERQEELTELAWNEGSKGDYINNIRDVAKGTFLEKTFNVLDQIAASYIPVHFPLTALKKIHYYPAIEYIYKCGYNNLVYEIINMPVSRGGVACSGKSIEKVMGVPKYYLNGVFDNRAEVTNEQVRTMKIAYELKLPSQLAKKMCNYYCGMDWDLVGKFFKKDLFANIKIKTAINWIFKQKYINVRDYMDYIGQCEELNMDLRDKDVLCPKDFEEIHDRLSKRIKYIVEDKKNAVYSQIYNKFKQMQVVSSEYSIMLPKNVADIIKEGQEMGHCVGSYVKQVLSGNSVIFFVRKTAEINSSFTTVEYLPKERKIAQYRGCGKGTANRQPPESVKNFLESWAELHKIKMAI